MTNDNQRPGPCRGMTCGADRCDADVGLVECSPFHCACGASQIGSHDKARELTTHEKRTSCYAPGSELGSSASAIGGHRVSHQEMRDAYRAEFTDNPLWHDKECVAKWYEWIRKGRHK